MRIAVLSDIHANLSALQTALADIERRQVDRVICLGDVVGYGPDPAPCVDLVRETCSITVLGNHDAAVAREHALEVLPRDGQAAARLHRTLLRDDQLAWLADLPLRAEAYGATFVHATPDRPEAWTRLQSFPSIQAQFEAFSTDICFVGHSHRPAVASSSMGVYRVRRGHRFLVDVGSVGQPRDRDPRLSYALYDDFAFSVELIRLHYDHARTAVRLDEVGLPASLGDRLRRGM
ncbi:MAG: metallophosphoesterase family protein [Bacteroidota bacterium]